jgi:hypothetical protein
LEGSRGGKEGRGEMTGREKGRGKDEGLGSQFTPRKNPGYAFAEN